MNLESSLGNLGTAAESDPARRLLTEMMHDYFEEADSTPANSSPPMPFSIPSIKTSEVPVRPVAKTDWEIGRAPRCLKKTFKFSKPAIMAAFLQELLAHEVETGHHGRLVCEFPHIEIEIRTHDLDDVAELDKEYAKTCDQIFEDVRHYGDHSQARFFDGQEW